MVREVASSLQYCKPASFSIRLSFLYFFGWQAFYYFLTLHHHFIHRSRISPHRPRHDGIQTRGRQGHPEGQRGQFSTFLTCDDTVNRVLNPDRITDTS